VRTNDNSLLSYTRERLEIPIAFAVGWKKRALLTRIYEKFKCSSVYLRQEDCLMEKKLLVWVGNRESEIESCPELFAHSITVYGSDTDKNTSYFDPHTGKHLPLTRDSFILQSICKFLKKHGECRFLFYSNHLANILLGMMPDLEKYIICVQKSSILEYLNSKTYTKLWFSHQIPVINFALFTKKEISYVNLCNIFGQNDSFVIQDDRSSGGIGSYLFNQSNAEVIINRLSESQLFIVSPYIKNSYSVNLHLMVCKQEVIIYPPSLQITELTDDRLIYKGADFIAAYTDIQKHIKSRLQEYCMTIGKMLRRINYRGICGLDFLICDNGAFLLEVNPRFQASSMLLDLSLRKEFGFGLMETHISAFGDTITEKQRRAAIDVTVPYSGISYYYYGDIGFYQYLLERLQNYSGTFLLCKDKQYMDPAIPFGSYLYRVLFKSPVSSVDFNGNLVLHQNLQNPLTIDTNIHSQMKIPLLTQGVICSSEIFSRNNIKNATFDAIDISIGDTVINCPLKGNFIPLSPWQIDYWGDALSLFYLHNRITNIRIDLQEILSVQSTKSGIPIRSICFRTTDRLRIKHTPLCRYKKTGDGCMFCHITTSNATRHYSLQDIYEVIDHYIDEIPFRHFMIGGPTGDEGNEEDIILRIIKYIRRKSQKPICVMSVPPNDVSVLSKYVEHGVTELAFNLEIYDRALAETTMPGKGKIPLAQYEKSFLEGVRLLGKKGAVRSMLLIGLDKTASILDGVRYLCSLGVSPMLSPFRPMSDTALFCRIPTDIFTINELLASAKEICDQYRMSLGPICKYCQNNTLV
jgi:hypothetical protein